MKHKFGIHFHHGLHRSRKTVFFDDDVYPLYQKVTVAMDGDSITFTHHGSVPWETSDNFCANVKFMGMQYPIHPDTLISVRANSITFTKPQCIEFVFIRDSFYPVNTCRIIVKYHSIGAISEYLEYPGGIIPLHSSEANEIERQFNFRRERLAHSIAFHVSLENIMFNAHTPELKIEDHLKFNFNAQEFYPAPKFVPGCIVVKEGADEFIKRPDGRVEMVLDHSAINDSLNDLKEMFKKINEDRTEIDTIELLRTVSSIRPGKPFILSSETVKAARTALEYVKKLIHHKDTTVGSYATDRPDKISDKKLDKYFWQIEF